MYKELIRPMLFRFQPEQIHDLAFGIFRFAQCIPGFCRMADLSSGKEKWTNPLRLFGLDFPNRVGLGAGLDKDGQVVPFLASLGFSFIEVGTVTPIAQPGNERPRLFRLKNDGALINRMGFNNQGAHALKRHLQNSIPVNCHIAVNIGKNKATPTENAASDYCTCVDILYEEAAFFVINVSSPNTPGLRSLQEKEPLRRLLSEVRNRIISKPQVRPVLVKIAPDLETPALDDILEIIMEVGIDGIVATNTTISRKGLKTDPEEVEAAGQGGLSGLPLRDVSTRIISHIHRSTSGALPIIGVGGIHDEKSAREKLDAGASLIEVYTGFIYEGPGLIRRLNKALSNH